VAWPRSTRVDAQPPTDVVNTHRRTTGLGDLRSDEEEPEGAQDGTMTPAIGRAAAGCFPGDITRKARSDANRPSPTGGLSPLRCGVQSSPAAVVAETFTSAAWLKESRSPRCWPSPALPRKRCLVSRPPPTGRLVETSAPVRSMTPWRTTPPPSNSAGPNSERSIVGPELGEHPATVLPFWGPT
jgi:hypothetical protein